MPSLLATLGNKLLARSRHRRRATAMTKEPQSEHSQTEPIGVIAPELATTTNTPSLPSMSFPPQQFSESLLSESSFSSFSSSSTSTSIPQLLQSVSPVEEASAAPPPQTSLSTKSSVSSFSSSPPPDRPPPPPPRPLFSSVAFLTLPSPSSPIPQPGPCIDTTVSPSFYSAASPTEPHPTTPVLPLISSATASKDIYPIEESQTVSASFSASSVPAPSYFPFKSRRTRQTKLSTPQTPSSVVPAVQPIEESAPVPIQKRTFLAFRVKKKTLKQADLPLATQTRTRLSLHAPSHSQSPLPSHSHSSNPPHSSNTRGASSPSTQTVAQSSFSHFSANSFKTSIRSQTTNLFSFKRFRRAPRPSFSSDRDFKTDHHPFDQQQQQQQPQQKRRISLRDPKRPTVDQDVAMQKVEYMSELYSGSMASFDMTPAAAGTGVGGEEEEEENTFMTGSSTSPHRQTLSSKRMRPPLAEISTAQAHRSSSSRSSPITMTKIEGVSCGNGGGPIYNRPALILHSSIGNSSNGGHIALPIDNTKSHNLTTTSNGGNNTYSFNATPVGTSSAAVSTLHHSLLVNNSKNNKRNNSGSIHYSIDTCNTSNTYNSNSNNSNITTTAKNNIQLNNNTERVRLAASGESEAEDQALLTHPPSIRPGATIASPTPRQGRKRATSRGQLSKDAKHIKMRIRKLWQDPRLPEHHQERRDPKVSVCAHCAQLEFFFYP